MLHKIITTVAAAAILGVGALAIANQRELDRRLAGNNSIPVLSSIQVEILKKQERQAGETEQIHKDVSDTNDRVKAIERGLNKLLIKQGIEPE